MAHRDHLIIQYKELQKEFKGISPKLELHGQLKIKLKALEKEIGNLDPNKIYRDWEKKGKKRPKLDRKTIENNKIQALNKKTICNFEGCNSRRATQGRTKSGIQKFTSLCGMHYKLKKRANKNVHNTQK